MGTVHSKHPWMLPILFEICDMKIHEQYSLDWISLDVKHAFATNRLQ